MKLELISFKLCPFVQRSIITLLYKNVNFKITHINPNELPEWFLAISPLGKVPVLRVNDEVLFESAVINEYVDEVNPPPLHPDLPLRKAHNRAWIEFASGMIGSQYGLLTCKENLEEKQQEIIKQSQQLEAQIQHAPYFNGGRLSLIDMSYAPIFMRYRLMERYSSFSYFKDFPKIQAWAFALLDLDCVKNSVVKDFDALFINYFGSEGLFTEKYKLVM